MHAFADESVRDTYLICAVLARPGEVDSVRRILRAHRKPGQRRVHFAKEGDARRRLMLSGLAKLDLRVRIYESTGPDVAARARCLRSLVDDLVNLGVQRLVLEKLETQVRADRLTIRSQLAVSTPEGDPQLAYQHLQAHEEPMLWAADAIAWAYGAGKDWRRRTAGLVDKAVRLDP